MTMIIFAMYNTDTDYVAVSLNAEIHVYFNCQKCNSSVRLGDASDIAYLTGDVCKIGFQRWLLARIC